jgi:hypothetical protein
VVQNDARPQVRRHSKAVTAIWAVCFIRLLLLRVLFRPRR